jgi:hypothetical protein
MHVQKASEESPTSKTGMATIQIATTKFMILKFGDISDCNTID